MTDGERLTAILPAYAILCEKASFHGKLDALAAGLGITTQGRLLGDVLDDIAAKTGVPRNDRLYGTFIRKLYAYVSDSDDATRFGSPLVLHNIAQLVADGKAQAILTPGDMINIPWNDNENGTVKATYTAPWHVAHFENAELPSGETVPVMDIEWHYTTPFGVPFDEKEAVYESDTGLAPGTYSITIANNAWLASENGKTYQFTLTEALPANGQLRANAEYNKTWEGTILSAYTSAYHRTKLFDVTLTEGSEGTNLGTTDGTGDVNHFHRLNLGYNRWATSCLRQWLNSTAVRNTEGNGDGWYVKQAKWDVMPTIALQKDGFLCGYSDDVLGCMLTTKIYTPRNTATDDGGIDVTNDKIFLKSSEQWYAAPDGTANEGYWEYWKQVLGLSQPMKQYEVYPLTKVYAINAKTSPQVSFRRSCNRGNGSTVWNAGTSGYVSNVTAGGSYRCEPACRIGKASTSAARRQQKAPERGD